MSMFNEVEMVEKELSKIGTASSGNYGHSGIEGHWGGSLPGGGHLKISGTKEALKKKGLRGLREHVKTLTSKIRIAKEKGENDWAAKRALGSAVSAYIALHKHTLPEGKWAKTSPNSHKFWGNIAYKHGMEPEFYTERAVRGVKGRKKVNA